MTKVSDITAFIEIIAPVELAESWDPIGLQIGNPQQKVEKIMLCLDMTASSFEKAIESGVDLVITHHPLIFSPISSVRSDKRNQKLIYQLIRNNISVYSAHTNLDAAAGGVADSLADSLDLVTAEWNIVIPFQAPFDSHVNDPVDKQTKVSGHGRYAALQQTIGFNMLRQRIISKLGSSGCRINIDYDKPVKKVAVFPGSFDETWIDRLVELNIDTVVTGECKHHVSISLAQSGISLLETGHDVSERVILEPLAAKLADKFSQISFVVDSGLDYNKMAF